MKRILLIGSGWRAEMWATLIDKLPGFFPAAVVCRSEEKARRFSSLGFTAVKSYKEGLDRGVDFILVCVSKQNAFSVARFFEDLGFSVLCETPAGNTEEEFAVLEKSKKIFFAEQYPLKPFFASLKKISYEGCLGNVHTLFLSCCHDYHAVAVMRHLLDTGDRIPEVSALSFGDNYSLNRDRRGGISPEIRQNRRVIAFLDFGEKRGIYDFSKAQYFSSIRRPRVSLQGEKGEISESGGCLRRGDSDVPCSLDFVYEGRGASLCPPDLSAVYFLGKKVYENPWKGLRLSEEEIAMAECLERFSRGKGYPAGEGVIDARIGAKLGLCGQGTQAGQE